MIITSIDQTVNSVLKLALSRECQDRGSRHKLTKAKTLKLLSWFLKLSHAAQLLITENPSGVLGLDEA